MFLLLLLFLSLIRLPSTFFHELSHLVFALLTFSRVVSFSLIPKVYGRSIALGTVKVSPSFKGALILIGLAPLSLWIIAFYISYYRIIIYDEIVTWIIVLYLFFGGVPSKQDLRSALDGLMSYSGIFLTFFIIIIFYTYLKGVI